MPVVCIRGPRQAGKTTLGRFCFPTFNYFSCDDDATLKAMEQDPRSFLRNALASSPGIIIDEFQRCPKILSAIKVYADETGRLGSIILTDSQNYLMMANVTQSLAGMVVLIDLLPLSINELTQAKLLPDNVYELIVNGSYPRLYNTPTVPKSSLYEDYINTYIQRDVQTLETVADLAQFYKFIQLCAGRIGQLLNLNSLANDADITVKQANQWLSLLATSYVLYLLPSHHVNFNKRLVKQPKLYFYDTGIAGQLLRINTPSELLDHPIRGALFKNFVINEVSKWFHANKKQPPLYFWCDESGREIDLIIDQAGTLIPVEIKSADTAKSTMTEGLAFWHQLSGHPFEQSYVIYTGADIASPDKPPFISWKNIPSLLTSLYK